MTPGRKFKGKGKGNKPAQPGSARGKVQFQGKKTKFDSDDEKGGAGKFFSECFGSFIRNLYFPEKLLNRENRNVVFHLYK
jgi:hypothetical protein